MSRRRARISASRLTSLIPLLLVAGIAACSDDPVRPTGPAPYATPAALALSDADLEKCRAFLDPDWLCDYAAVREQLCFAARTTTSIDIVAKGRLITLTYRVTFQPAVDGGRMISLFFLKADGTLVPIGNPVVVPPERLAAFLEGCPPPDLTNMVFRTVFTSPAGVAIQRDHRAVAGDVTALDIDDMPGTDLSADVDYTPSTMAIALTRADGAAALSFSIQAIRDATAADDRSLQVDVDALPTSVTLALDSDAKRFSGSVSSAVRRLVANMGGGLGQPAGALSAVDGVFADVAGTFELSLPQSGAEFRSSAAIGMVDVRASAGVSATVVHPAGAALLLTGDGSGVALRLHRVELFRIIAPLTIDAVMASSSQFGIDIISPNARTTSRLTSAPSVFNLGVTERATATGTRASISWRGSQALGRMSLDMTGVSGLGGGQLSAEFTDVPVEGTMTLAVPPTTSSEPVRFDILTSAGTGDVQLIATPGGGFPRFQLSLTNIPLGVRGCLAHDGACRPTDRLPGALSDYFGDANPLFVSPDQSATAGGLNRPYPARLSIDVETTGGAPSAFLATLSSTLDRGDGNPLTIRNLRFSRFALDLGFHPTSPTFSVGTRPEIPGATLPESFVEGGPWPRIYFFVDSEDRPYVLDELTMPALVQSLRIGSTSAPAAANSRLAWLPGVRCNAFFGSCVSADLDPRTAGAHTCGGQRVFTVRHEGVGYNLLDHLGREALRVCTQ